MKVVEDIKSFNASLEAYEVAFEKRYGSRPLFIERDSSNKLRNLAVTHGSKLMRGLLAHYLELDGLSDDYFKNRGHVLDVFFQKLNQLHASYSLQEKRRRDNAVGGVQSPVATRVWYFFILDNNYGALGFVKLSETSIETTEGLPRVTLTFQEIVAAVDQEDLTRPGLFEEIIKSLVAKKRGDDSFDKARRRLEIDEICRKNFLTNKSRMLREVPW